MLQISQTGRFTAMEAHGEAVTPVDTAAYARRYVRSPGWCLAGIHASCAELASLVRQIGTRGDGPAPTRVPLCGFTRMACVLLSVPPECRLTPELPTAGGVADTIRLETNPAPGFSLKGHT
jgi:hypothetical protein